MRIPPTIEDIADALHLSKATVSRALRDHPDVSPETKKAVVALAKKLDYEPNRLAQSLRSHKTNTIGVVVPEIAMHFFSSTLSGMQEYALRHDYIIMVCQSMESYQHEKVSVQKLTSNRVDGLLISLSSETRNVDHLRHLMEKRIPLVLFDRVCDDLHVSKVIVNDYDAAFKAVDYLIKTGCRRIAYVGGPRDLYINERREHGYLDALRKSGIAPSEDWIIHCKDLHTEPVSATQHLLHLPSTPDAIFCMNDPIAILVMQVLKEQCVQIPDEISVIGFTNEPVSNFIVPSLTTVSQPSFEMGKTAAQLFIEEMENPESYIPVTKVLPTELIIRNSTRKLFSKVLET